MNFNRLKNKINEFLFEKDPENETFEPVRLKEEPKKEIIEEPEETTLKAEPKSVFIDVEPKIEIIEEPVKTEPKPEPKVEAIAEPYEFKGIISPFYGTENKRNITPIKHIETSIKATEINGSVISPFYGYDAELANQKRDTSKVLYRKKRMVREVQEKSEEEKPVKKRRRTKEKAQSSDCATVRS